MKDTYSESQWSCRGCPSNNCFVGGLERKMVDIIVGDVRMTMRHLF